MSNTRELLAYAPKELYEQIRKLAFIRHQSISKTIIQCLEDCLKALGKD